MRRGYFVAERGATQFALPGAEERLRAKRPDDEEPRTLVLGATDPANPWGSLLPWPREARETAAAHGTEGAASEAAGPGRSAQRVPGARVIMHDGKLLAWVGRGGQSMITFLPKEEPDASHAARALANALVGIARRRVGIAMLATIDGGPAPESPIAKVLGEHGFAARRGALVFVPGRAPPTAAAEAPPEPLDFDDELVDEELALDDEVALDELEHTNA